MAKTRRKSPAVTCPILGKNDRHRFVFYSHRSNVLEDSLEQFCTWCDQCFGRSSMNDDSNEHGNHCVHLTLFGLFLVIVCNMFDLTSILQLVTSNSQLQSFPS